MKPITTRTVGLALILVTLTGCTTAYKNGQICKQKMVETYPGNFPKLSYSIPRSTLHARKILVEATYPYTLPVPYGNTPIKTKVVDAPVAVLCTFEGETMTSFAYLAPDSLSARYPLPATVTDEPANN